MLRIDFSKLSSVVFDDLPRMRFMRRVLLTISNTHLLCPDPSRILHPSIGKACALA